MAVPYIFAASTSAIPLANLDSNFAYFANAITVSSGNVGIGTSSPVNKVDVSGSITLRGDYETYLVNSYYDSSWKYAGNGMAWGIGNNFGGPTNGMCIATAAVNSSGSGAALSWSPRLSIDSSGNVLVGTTSTQDNARLRVFGSSTSGTNYTLLIEGSGGADNFYVRDDGEMYSLPTYNRTSAGASNVGVDSAGGFFRSTSSLKYKTDVQDAKHGLAQVMQLRPVTYKGKNDGETVFGGLIAEEVHESGLTEFVQYAKDGTPDALAYGNMVSLCIKAIQEQQALINELRARVAALESQP